MRTLIAAVLAFISGAALMLGAVDRVVPIAVPTPATTASAHAALLPDSAAETDAAPADIWPPLAPSPEQVITAQPRLMQQALTALTPRVPGRPNLYLIAFAGDGSENVFRNEAEYAARLFKQRYGPSAHPLVLENNPATLATQPLASWTNLDAALDGIAKRLDREQDIVMLYLTSHGSEDHYLTVDMEPLPLDTIGAEDLTGILAPHHFKWKVIVVNACYSGGFIPPLQGAGTLIITAARPDRSSFGCGSASDITYFGQAFLVDGLNHSNSFAGAFNLARSEVNTWEKRDGFVPSIPQIDAGAGIYSQLDAWSKGLHLGPPLPFKPAAPVAQKAHRGARQN